MLLSRLGNGQPLNATGRARPLTRGRRCSRMILALSSQATERGNQGELSARKWKRADVGEDTGRSKGTQGNSVAVFFALICKASTEVLPPLCAGWVGSRTPIKGKFLNSPS